MFITAFEGVLDLETGQFNFVNAGHETPFLCKKGEGYAPYKIRPGFVLAGMEGTRYRMGSLQMQPGDKLFQYTDGVTEATNAANELYGMERLEAVLIRGAEAAPGELLPAVKADIDAFVGGAPQFDDITMLCLEFKEMMNASDPSDLTVEATLESIPAVTAFVDQQLEALDCPMKAQMQIDVHRRVVRQHCPVRLRSGHRPGHGAGGCGSGAAGGAHHVHRPRQTLRPTG